MLFVCNIIIFKLNQMIKSIRYSAAAAASSSNHQQQQQHYHNHRGLLCHSIKRDRRLRKCSRSSSSRTKGADDNSNEQKVMYPNLLHEMVYATQLCAKLTTKTQELLMKTDKVSKSDDSPVTVADYAAQAVVSYVLEKSFPKIPLLAEEDAVELRKNDNLLKRVTELLNECVDDEDIAEEEVLRLIDRGNFKGGNDCAFFCLDPIDGTKGFINQRQYAIALGYCENGKVVAGVLGCPNMPMKKIIVQESSEDDLDFLETEKPGVIFAAYENFGCRYASMYAKEPLGKDSFLAKSDELIKSGKYGARYMESWGDSIVADHAFTNALSEKVGITRKPLRVDSMAKYACLSRGDAHIYLRFPPKSYREKVWDHCAGAIIVTESGGVISDASGLPLDFGNGRFLDINEGIIASSNQELHDELLNAIAILRTTI